MSDSSGVCDQIIIYFLLLSVPNSHQQFFVQSNYVCSLTSAHAFQIPIPYVYFSANVESFDGEVEEVTLHYSLDSDNWNQTTMNNGLGGSEYNTVMTFDDSNVIVYYYITASNSLNLCFKNILIFLLSPFSLSHS